MSFNNNINIPLEIILDILLRLPLKSIFRFKCVCKSWYLLIQSHEFYKLHLNRSLTQNSYNCSLILPVTRNIILNGSPAAASFVYRAYLNPNSANLDLKELTLPLSFRPSLEKISNLVYRFLNNSYKRHVYGQIEVVGSCNGLLLIVRGMHHYTVCNPAIEHDHAFKILPCITYPSYSFFRDPERTSYYYRLTGRTRSLSHRVFGFGYDSVNCGYKVVYLSAKRALVYSFATDGRSWREVDLPYDIIKNGVDPPAWGTTDQEKKVLLMHMYSHGVATNNNLHWNVTEYDSDVFEYSWESILSFDICKEEWGKVAVPNELDKRLSFSGVAVKPYIIELGVLNGCLCLITSRGISYPDLNLWIMKEYGVKESWTKMFKVPNGSGIPLFYHRERFEFLLPGFNHGLGWFNPSTNKIRKVEFHGCDFTGENYYSTRGRMCLETFADPSARIKQIGKFCL